MLLCNAAPSPISGDGAAPAGVGEPERDGLPDGMERLRPPLRPLRHPRRSHTQVGLTAVAKNYTHQQLSMTKV